MREGIVREVVPSATGLVALPLRVAADQRPHFALLLELPFVRPRFELRAGERRVLGNNGAIALPELVIAVAEKAAAENLALRRDLADRLAVGRECDERLAKLGGRSLAGDSFSL